jgi:hypothetical protein
MEGEIAFRRFNPKTLPEDCYYSKNKTVIKDQAYRKHVETYLSVSSGRRLNGMYTRTIESGDISFYDCMRIIMYSKKHGEGIKPPSKPIRDSEVIKYNKEINNIKTVLTTCIKSRNDNTNNERLIKTWVNGWKQNIQTLYDRYPTAEQGHLLQFTEINSIQSYLTKTNYLWYGVTEVELESAPLAFGINIVIWDMKLATYKSYKDVHNDLYCILTKEDNQYHLKYGRSDERKFVYMFTWDDLHLETKALFSLFANEEANYEYYLKRSLE